VNDDYFEFGGWLQVWFRLWLFWGYCFDVEGSVVEIKTRRNAVPESMTTASIPHQSPPEGIFKFTCFRVWYVRLVGMRAKSLNSDHHRIANNNGLLLLMLEATPSMLKLIAVWYLHLLPFQNPLAPRYERSHSPDRKEADLKLRPHLLPCTLVKRESGVKTRGVPFTSR
jgi:hypothetical protein